jgi:hypothetical protein
MLRILAAACMLCTLAASVSGCAGSHMSAGSDSSAPHWLRSLARREAVLMRDSHPKRIRFQLGLPAEPPFAAGGHEDVIELWGRFTCAPTRGCNLIASCGPPTRPGHHNSCTFRGTYARMEVSPGTHQVMGFELSHRA